MIDERLRELVRLRVQQAEETLHEAQILCDKHTGRGAVNRAYADYGEQTQFDAPTVTRMIQDADAFIQNIRAYMKTQGVLSAD